MSKTTERIDSAKKKHPKKVHRYPPGSRAKNVARIKDLADSGLNRRQIAAEIGVSEGYLANLLNEERISITADAVVGKSRRVDSVRVMREGVNALEGAVIGFRLVDPVDLDPDEVEQWVASLNSSIQAVKKLILKLMKETTRDEQ